MKIVYFTKFQYTKNISKYGSRSDIRKIGEKLRDKDDMNT